MTDKFSFRSPTISDLREKVRGILGVISFGAFWGQKLHAVEISRAPSGGFRAVVRYTYPSWTTPIVLLLAFVSVQAKAEPYLKFAPFSETYAGAFFKLGAAQNDTSLGIVTPVLMHKATSTRDVSWNALNAGWIKATSPASKGAIALGPSVQLGEPLKAVLRRGVGFLPGGSDTSSYGALRAILSPADDSHAIYLEIGPVWVLDTQSGRGSAQLMATMVKKW